MVQFAAAGVAGGPGLECWRGNLREIDVGFDPTLLFWAFIVIGVLMLMTRWVFKPSRPRTGRPESGPNANLGMLAPVLAAAGRTDALEAKNLLSQRGVRCSVSRLDRDSYDVLVFKTDMDRAKELLAGRTP